MVTPEMLSYFSEELAANASRALINRVTESSCYKVIKQKLGVKAALTMPPWR